MDDGSLLAATRAAAARPAARRRAYDHDEALKNVGGSAALLAEMAALLAFEAPQQMADIEAAYAARDADALNRAAHSLKGSVSLFGAAAAMAGARRIEELARTGRLVEFPPAWADLQKLVQDLLEALGELNAAKP
jgi:HPt (histidine-containing phosphotransfer) domain-containing protein